MQEYYNSTDTVEEEKSSDIAKCPGCGANMVFSPVDQLLKCEHCGNVINFAGGERATQIAIEHMFANAVPWAGETHTFRCDNCGASEVIAKTEIAKACSFCGATNVLETQQLSGVKPNAIVPFVINNEQAAQRVTTWARKKLFAPKYFRRSAAPDQIRGIYSPAFVFDCKTSSMYVGRLGKYYYETRRTKNGTTRVRKVRYFNIRGTYSDAFGEVLIQASSDTTQKTIRKIGPFDTRNSRPYAMEYLPGFSAMQYSKDGMTCWKEAQATIDPMIRRRILNQYSHDVVDFIRVSTQYSNVTYKYVLLPLYVGHCNWHNKTYNFYVNGANGRIHGQTPVSGLKVTLTVLVSTVGVGLLTLLGILLLR